MSITLFYFVCEEGFKVWVCILRMSQNIRKEKKIVEYLLFRVHSESLSIDIHSNLAPYQFLSTRHTIIALSLSAMRQFF
jgi:hypothetical protein